MHFQAGYCLCHFHPSRRQDTSQLEGKKVSSHDCAEVTYLLDCIYRKTILPWLCAQELIGESGFSLGENIRQLWQRVRRRERAKKRPAHNGEAAVVWHRIRQEQNRPAVGTCRTRRRMLSRYTRARIPPMTIQKKISPPGHFGDGTLHRVMPDQHRYGDSDKRTVNCRNFEDAGRSGKAASFHRTLLSHFRVPQQRLLLALPTIILCR